MQMECTSSPVGKSRMARLVEVSNLSSSNVGYQKYDKKCLQDSTRKCKSFLRIECTCVCVFLLLLLLFCFVLFCFVLFVLLFSFVLVFLLVKSYPLSLSNIVLFI